MPLAAAVIGSAVVGGIVSNSASKKAAKAATTAADENAAVQREQYQQTRADLQPYTQSGYTAQGALMQRLGLSGPAAAAPAAAKPAGGFAGTSPALITSGGGGGGAGSSVGAAGGTGAPGRVYAPGDASWQANAPTGGMDLAQGGYTAHTGGALNPSQTQALLADRPDVAGSSWLNSIDPKVIGDRTGDGQVTQDDRAAYWYDNYGKEAGYQLQGAPAPTPQAPPPAIPGQTLTSSDNGGLGARQEAPRPEAPRPTFSEAQPTFTTPTFGQAPTSGDYLDPSKFATSPGYEFRLNEGTRNLNAKYGAKGLLKSDAAIKGINDYGQGMASQEYGNWFNQQMAKLGADQGQYNTDRASTLGQFNNDRATGLAQYNQNRNVFNTNYNADTARSDQNYNTDRGRYDANFNADRGYNTAQYDQYTGNLFQLAGMGQSAAAGTAAAGQNYANATTANNNALASVQGNAAIAGANGINSAINSGVQAYGMYSNPFSVTNLPTSSSTSWTGFTFP